MEGGSSEIVQIALKSKDEENSDLEIQIDNESKILKESIFEEEKKYRENSIFEEKKEIPGELNS